MYRAFITGPQGVSTWGVANLGNTNVFKYDTLEEAQKAAEAYLGSIKNSLPQGWYMFVLNMDTLRVEASVQTAPRVDWDIKCF